MRAADFAYDVRDPDNDYEEEDEIDSEVCFDHHQLVP